MRKELRYWFLPAAAALFILVLTAWWIWGQRLPLYGERHIIVLDPEGREISIGLEEFLVGVVAAEMPASFHMEALKAQAVASRTYIAARLEPYGYGKHGDAVVCCDSKCCQAYLDDAGLRERWGENYGYYRKRVAQAVKATNRQVLMWHGRPADALFHSACGGLTEDASAVWGRSIPYLVPVACGYCKHAPRYTGWVSYSLAEAAELLDTDQDALRAMQALADTPGGRVGIVKLGNTLKKGPELRQALSLNSAAFHWLIMGDDILFCCVGFGHGVGMCQYGADGMGEHGYTYDEILAHYYPCTELKRLPAP